MVRVILSGRDVTHLLKEVNIQEGTKRSDVIIIRLKYLDGKVETKVALPHPFHRKYKIIRAES
ncbi:MAG: hypothetical protein ACTSV7_03150 [Candidatus Baldrarchaeia archaeon]